MVAVTVHSVEIHCGIVEEDEGHVSLVLSEAGQHWSVSVVSPGRVVHSSSELHNMLLTPAL